jgi:hypothetical protein
MTSQNMDILSGECVWTGIGTMSYCGDGANVVAPNLLWNGKYMLPTGAVLGDAATYWNNGVGTTSLAGARA